MIILPIINIQFLTFVLPPVGYTSPARNTVFLVVDIQCIFEMKGLPAASIFKSAICRTNCFPRPNPTLFVFPGLNNSQSIIPQANFAVYIITWLEMLYITHYEKIVVFILGDNESFKRKLWNDIGRIFVLKVKWNWKWLSQWRSQASWRRLGMA